MRPDNRRLPVEDLLARRRDRDESQGTEERSDEDAVDRQARLGAPLEDARRLALDGESVEGTAGGIEVRVSGRPSGDKEDGIDDAGERFDLGLVDSDDEGGRGHGVAVRAEKLGVRVLDVDSDDEDGEEVEEEL